MEEDTILIVVVGQAWGRDLVERLLQEQSLADVWADYGPTEAYLKVLWNKDAPFSTDDELRTWIWQNVPETEGISIATGEECGL
jgi:hypothetical protein